MSEILQLKKKLVLHSFAKQFLMFQVILLTIVV